VTAPEFTTAEQATAYIREHDAYVRQLTRKAKAELARMYRQAHPGLVIGEPEEWAKDSLINYLTDERYPDLNRAIEVRYAPLPAATPAVHAVPHFRHNPVAGNDWCLCPCPECYGHVEGLEGMDCICPDCGCHAPPDDDMAPPCANCGSRIRYACCAGCPGRVEPRSE
jgi:hypothetical protein